MDSKKAIDLLRAYSGVPFSVKDKHKNDPFVNYFGSTKSGASTLENICAVHDARREQLFLLGQLLGKRA